MYIFKGKPNHTYTVRFHVDISFDIHGSDEFHFFLSEFFHVSIRKTDISQQLFEKKNKEENENTQLNVNHCSNETDHMYENEVK